MAYGDVSGKTIGYAKSSSSSDDINKKLLEFLKRAEQEGIKVKDKPTLFQRIIGALSASETASVVRDVRSGKDFGETAGNYLDRIKRGWTMASLADDELKGYKDILAEEGMSTKGIFGGKGPSPAGTVGLAADIFLDPMTYLGAGLIGKGGKALAKEGGEKLLKEGAKEMGERGVKKVLGGKAVKTADTFGQEIGLRLPTRAMQAEAGERSLLKLNIPFTEKSVPLLPKKVNAKIYSKLDDFISKKVAPSPVGRLHDYIRNAFDKTAAPLSMYGKADELRNFYGPIADARTAKNTLATGLRESKEAAKDMYMKAIDFAGGWNVGKGKTAISQLFGVKSPEGARSAMKTVINVMETAKGKNAMEILEKMDKDLLPLAAAADNFRNAIAKTRKAYGINDLADDEIGYWLHYLSPERKGIMSKFFGIGPREFSTKNLSDMDRSILKFTNPDGTTFVGKLTGGRLLHGKWNKVDNTWTNSVHVKELPTEGIPPGVLSGYEALTLDKFKRRMEALGYKLDYVEKPKGTAIGELELPALKLIGRDKDVGKSRIWVATSEPFDSTTPGDKTIMGTIFHEMTHKFHGMLIEAEGIVKHASGYVPPWQKALLEKYKPLEEAIAKEAKAIGKLTGLGNYGSVYSDRTTELLAWANEYARTNPKWSMEEFPETFKRLQDFNKEMEKIFGKFPKPGSVPKDTFKAGKDRLLVGPKGRLMKASWATIEEIEKETGIQFSTNIAETAFIMGARVASQAAGFEYFDLIKKYGVSGDKAPQHYVKLMNKDEMPKGMEAFVKSSAKELRDADLYFHPEVAKMIDNTFQAYFTDDAVRDVLKIYDSMLGFWKSSVTGLFPSFHARNFMSNLWQNWIGGVRSPAGYFRSARILSALKAGKELTGKDKEIWDNYLAHGLSGYGFFGGELKEIATQEVPQKNVVGTVADVVKAPFETWKKGGMKVGTTVEDFGKLAHFIDKVNKKMSYAEAAQSARKYLFDYTDLTPFEKNVMKRLIPFYTFTRKNLPMELQALVNNPGDFGMLTKVMKASGLETEGLPEWMQGTPSFKMGEEDGKSKYMYGVDVPAFQPAEVASNPLNMISPLIKTPIELAYNKSSFTGQEITKDNKVEGVIGKQIEKLGMLDMFNLTKTEDGQYLTSNPKLWYVLEQFLSRGLFTASRVEKMTREEADEMLKWAYFLTGVKFKDVDKKKQAEYDQSELFEQIGEMLKNKGVAKEYSPWGTRKYYIPKENK